VELGRPSLKGSWRCAEDIYVRPKTRLDPVVKLEEKREEQRLAEMSEAARVLKAAEDQLEQRRTHARSDQRRTASASDWQLAELSHARVLSEVRAAEHAVNDASVASTASRNRYTEAYTRAEAIRRVAAARVEEIVLAQDRAERREHDELGVLRFGRAAA
jgi:flagellar export protein FliJ